jgi:hypothetical protein
MTASAKALRAVFHFHDPMISYANLHKMANRATPEILLKYKMSLLLYRTYDILRDITQIYTWKRAWHLKLIGFPVCQCIYFLNVT